MTKKLSLDSNAAENLLALYSFLITAHQAFSLTQLAERFAVSKPTMLRYLRKMEKSHFGKVQCELRGREHFYWLERPHSIPKIALSPHGLQQLALCRDFMAHILPLSMQKSIDSTLQQATAYLPAASLECLGTQCMDMGQSFRKGAIDYTPFEARLKVLMQAISEQSVCIVSYKKHRSQAPSSFDYAPQRLISYNDALYIRGWKVTERGSVATLLERGTDLALHRIEDVVLTVRSSQSLPPTPEMAQGAFGYMDIEPFQVKIQFSCALSTYVAERMWSADQYIEDTEDKGIILTMTARSDYEIVPWVLGFGAEATVLEPTWLCEAIKKAGQDISALYENVDVR